MRLIRIYIYKYLYLSNINDWILSADYPIYSPSSSTSSTRIKFFKVHPFSTIIRFTLRRAMMMRTIQKTCTNVKFIAENTTWNEFVVILKFPLFINPTFSPIFNDVKTTPLCQEKGWGELKKLLLGYWRRAWRDHRFIFTRTFPLLEFSCYFFYQLGIFKQIYHGHTQCF